MASKWQPIETAPSELTVWIKLGRKKLRARFQNDCSMTEDGQLCGQWQAIDDNYPRCWSEGACWSSNADGEASMQPEGWMPL